MWIRVTDRRISKQEIEEAVCAIHEIIITGDSLIEIEPNGYVQRIIPLDDIATLFVSETTRAARLTELFCGASLIAAGCIAGYSVLAGNSTWKFFLACVALAAFLFGAMLLYDGIMARNKHWLDIRLRSTGAKVRLGLDKRRYDWMMLENIVSALRKALQRRADNFANASRHSSGTSA